MCFMSMAIERDFPLELLFLCFIFKYSIDFYKNTLGFISMAVGRDFPLQYPPQRTKTHVNHHFE